MTSTTALNACTVIARNYLPSARVLADSFFEQHPDGRMTVLVLDDADHRVNDVDERFDILRLDDIDFGHGELNQMLMIYDVMELATAVKPWLLQHLLDQGATEIVYFDPDIQIFSSLLPIAEAARSRSVVLTPHTTSPIPRDGRRITEAEIMASGIYNLGFIALGNTSDARKLLAWWSERLRRDCVVDLPQMLFVDQRWMDFVPGYFDHVVLRDPSVNVAYWNVYSRRLIWTGEHYEVNGIPLTFFHFSGYDPDVPYLLSKHMGDTPRVLMSDQPALKRICAEYGQLLLQAGFRTWKSEPYALNEVPGGLSIDRRIRRLYRGALVSHEKGDGPAPPDPFAGEVADLVSWLNEPVILRPGQPISRYLHALYTERGDLQDTCGDLAGHGGDRYLDWVVNHGRHEVGIPAALVPARTHPDTGHESHPPLQPGVNIAGYFKAELGVGEAGRLLLAAVKSSGTPYSVVLNTEALSRQEHPFAESVSTGAPYGTSIICVNADMTPSYAHGEGRELFENRYKIGLWFWEVEKFPESMYPSFEYVDEVWVATDHVRMALENVSPKPVLTIPLPVIRPQYSGSITRASLGLPEGFLFLFSFDFLSVMERKNPLGLIEAFTRAFKPGSRAKLVVKTINGDKKAGDLERLRFAADQHPDITVIDQYVSADESAALMSLCDGYVSLHRAEGFGLTIAEAMALGKPVIATGYSGNVDFMTPDNSYPVPFTLQPIGVGYAPYPQDARWAEPDLAYAARTMRHIFEHQDEARRVGFQAQHDMEEKRSPLACARFVCERLSEIERERTARDTTTTTPPTYPSTPSSAQAIARSLLRREPEVTSPTKRGAPWAWGVHLARRAVFRVLRNYHHDQRQAGLAMLQYVNELEERRQQQIDTLFSELARDQRLHGQSSQVVQSIQNVEADLQSVTERLSRENEGASRHLQTVDEKLEVLRGDTYESLQALREQATQSNQNLGEELQSVAERLSAENEQASRHLQVIDEKLQEVRARVAEIRAEMDAVPYMSHPEALAMHDRDGRESIGYEAGQEEVNGRTVYRDFEDIFRGSEEFIRERQRRYLDRLQGMDPVVDIGCGRGELLDVLAEAGISAVGVDTDEGMVARAREKGHAVVHQNGLDYLADQPDGSIGAIFCAQVIEHMTYSALLDFLHQAHLKLRADGLLVVETVNPHSHRAMKTFYVDLTHEKPIFPEVLVALCRIEEFGKAEVIFPNGTGDLELDRRTQGEYAVLATPSVD